MLDVVLDGKSALIEALAHLDESTRTPEQPTE